MSSIGTPPITTRSRSRSRVVPGIGVTMAASWPASRFSSVLLPALGRPAMTMFRPSLSTRPWALACSRRRQVAAQRVGHHTQARKRREVQVLVGEVDARLHLHAQRDQPLAQRIRRVH